MRCILILTNVCSATDRDVCRRQELKELRHRCKMAEEESATQSSARADMQDRLQAALDAIASGSEMAECELPVIRSCSALQDATSASAR